MRIRRKNVDGKNLVVQYLVGSEIPYMGFHTIETQSAEEALALAALDDEALIKQVELGLGEQMLADLSAHYK
jgi:hypothetical protein